MTAADRFTTVLAVLVLLGGCGGGEPAPSGGPSGGARPATTPAGATRSTPPSGPASSPSQQQRLVLTVADHGRTISVSASAAVIVRLTTSTSATWSDLYGAGPAEIVPVEYRTNPGYREWEIRLTGAGTLTLDSSCSGPGCQRSGFRVVLQVAN